VAVAVGVDDSIEAAAVGVAFGIVEIKGIVGIGCRAAEGAAAVAVELVAAVVETAVEGTHRPGTLHHLPLQQEGESSV